MFYVGTGENTAASGEETTAVPPGENTNNIEYGNKRLLINRRKYYLIETIRHEIPCFIFSFILLVCCDMFSLTLVFFCFIQLQRKPLHHQMEKQQLSDQVKFRMTQVGSQDKRRYLALINRARCLYGRILTEVVSADRTQ